MPVELRKDLIPHPQLAPKPSAFKPTSGQPYNQVEKFGFF